LSKDFGTTELLLLQVCFSLHLMWTDKHSLCEFLNMQTCLCVVHTTENGQENMSNTTTSQLKGAETLEQSLPKHKNILFRAICWCDHHLISMEPVYLK